MSTSSRREHAKGFLAPAEFATVLQNIPHAEARDLVVFLYNSGWRSGEGKSLEWSEVDLKTNMIRFAGREIEVEEAAKSADNRRAHGNHTEADRGQAVGLPVRVPSSG